MRKEYFHAMRQHQLHNTPACSPCVMSWSKQIEHILVPCIILAAFTRHQAAGSPSKPALLYIAKYQGNISALCIIHKLRANKRRIPHYVTQLRRRLSIIPVNA
ncbi:MAG: hypothetical protein R3E61_09940 [Pseudomonadales bacterium]